MLNENERLYIQPTADGIRLVLIAADGSQAEIEFLDPEIYRATIDTLIHYGAEKWGLLDE